MRLLADYHVHSKFSRFFHAKNTIEELVLSANAMGLQEIAVTDHGYKHWCRTSKANMKKARQIIDEINEWSTTKVLLGIEADIIAEDGTIDVDNETLAMIDILIVGYHRLIKTDFANYFGGTPKTKEAVQKCTNAFLNAIERYPITIISHLDSILTTDLYQIGVACKEKGVLVEINNRHTKWTKEQIDELIASDCSFVVNSDAHRREDVGEVDRAFEIIKNYKLPTENIVNVEFAMEERTDRDIEIQTYYGMYKKQIDNKLKKMEALEEKKKVEFTESLSPEMEKALREIAQEQGLKYEEKQSDEDEDDIFFGVTTLDEVNLIRQAQEYLSQNKLKEFDNQNEKIESVEVVTEQSEQPSIIAPTETVETNQLEQLKVEEIQENPIKAAIEVAQPPKEEPAVKVEEKKDDTVLNFAVKTNKQTNSSVASKTTAKVTVTKNEPTQKRAPSQQKAQSNVTVLKLPEEEKPAPKKPAPKQRGGFVNAGGIVGTAEKNDATKKSKTTNKN